MLISVEVNGQPYEFKEGSTLEDVLQTLQLSREQVAIERNLEVVPRATYQNVYLEPQDRIEVLSFVGGG